MNHIESSQSQALLPTDIFNEVVNLTLQTVAASSARIYGQTFNLWATYAHDAGLHPLDLRPANVLAFLAGQDVTKATRQRQLSALRKLAQMAYVLSGSDDARRIHEALMMVKVPTGAASGKERARRALQPREADKVLRVWDGDSLTDKRNCALIAVLALGGVRRAEAAALRWRDVDFENGVLTIAHGKGDKRREVPLAGDYAIEALRSWQTAQGSSREYVFCALQKNDTLRADKPISGTDVYRIVKATEVRAGVEFKPHDLRRTLITEALATGTPLATVQAIAGHARGETTLAYAQAVDARRARKELKLRYG
jgi:integrase/recombinase XerD